MYSIQEFRELLVNQLPARCQLVVRKKSGKLLTSTKHIPYRRSSKLVTPVQFSTWILQAGAPAALT